MMKQFMAVLLTGSLLFLLPSYAQADIWYVKKSGTKVNQEKSARSPVVSVLQAGTPVSVLEKSKRFFKVNVNGKRGWVFKFKLTTRAPKNAKGGGGLGALVGNQRMAANEASSASSIRGLSPVSEKYAKGKGISQANIDAVKQMEDFKVTDQDVDHFLQEGQLGEYAQ